MAKNHKELAVMLEKAALKALQTGSHTKELLVKTGQEQVQTVVYDSYSPVEYNRTGELKASFVVANESNGISLDNVRADDGQDVATVVETGEGYQFPDEYGYGYGEPRPFMGNTAEKLKYSGELVEAAMKDVRKAGYKTIK
ncbi:MULTISPECIES: hypothetical protein [Bacillus]|uniref:hypothetical protein n=1 Tax=Bacillus TaxID=1386 RepID=UPI000D024819|nr:MULTISPECIES: hypothetical protein [Bacillus]MCY7500092.1 hypothetical protein [Bacillus pumilus]MCY7528584.1 hypothetical protein [Bacillus pumilus]MED4439456.1 hypothetical protein [Bacillus pumilus]MED4489899.1 hypothetical protein [Bacillus pumilus]PRS47475.1 hypothetical protein C6Y06_18150 [Bacillus sp. MZGC1]